MKDFRDFFYDISDLIIALIVILIITFSFYKHISVFFTDIFGENLTTNITQIANENKKDTPLHTTQTANTNDDSTQKTQDNNAVLQNNRADEENKNSSVTNINNTNNTSNPNNENAVFQLAENNPNTSTQDNSTEITNIFSDKNNANADQASQNNINSSAKDVTINIPENTVSEDVLNILYDNGIISSKDEARKYIYENKLDTKLKSGKFTLNTGMSKEQVFSKLTQ